jgi:RNA recognition motif-containing protein
MNVYVANLSREITEESLRYTFSAFGQVRSVIITRNETTDEASAFVSMPIESEAQTAIRQMNGADLDGRTIQVEKSRTKPNLLDHRDKPSDARRDPRRQSKRGRGKHAATKRNGAKRNGAKRNRRGRGNRGKRMKS